MKHRILRHKFALWMIAALTLASCSQDELAEKDTSLPYGKYPLELTATIGEAVATPATRGTVHGTWPDGYTGNYLRIASSIDYPEENEIDWYKDIWKSTTYKIYEDGTMVLDYTGSFDDIYWRRSDEIIYVYAYSLGTLPDERINYPCSVSEDQRKEWVFNGCDYLFAYAALTFNGSHTLNFRHLTSKITINLMRSDYLDKQDLEEVEVTLTSKDEQWYVEGNFIGTNPKEVTLFEAEGLKQSKEIIPYKNPNPAADDIYATYEAVVIPQTITDTGKTIRIKVGETTYSYEVKCEKGKFASGEEWIYNIRLDAKGLDVTVEECIGWGTGNSGSGEVELP